MLVVNRNSTLLRVVRAVCYIATDDMVGCPCVMEVDVFHMFKKKLLYAQTSTIPINSMNIFLKYMFTEPKVAWEFAKKT